MSIVRRDYYKKGAWNAHSDQDGQKRKSTDMRMQWDGLWVGKDEFDPKHPQLSIRPRPDNIARYPIRVNEPDNLHIVPPFPPKPELVATVYDSDGTPYSVNNIVYDSDDKPHAVSPYVSDSNGEEVRIFVQTKPTIGV